MMRVTYLGHSGFLLEMEDAVVVAAAVAVAAAGSPYFEWNVNFIKI